MRAFTLAMAAALLAVSVQAQAATKIRFPKGSYCGSYSGSSSGSKTFTLWLKAGQTLTVNHVSARYISFNPKKLSSLGCSGDSCQYVALKRGNHSVTLLGSDWESVEFCAY